MVIYVHIPELDSRLPELMITGGDHRKTARWHERCCRAPSTERHAVQNYNKLTRRHPLRCNSKRDANRAAAHVAMAVCQTETAVTANTDERRGAELCVECGYLV